MLPVSSLGLTVVYNRKCLSLWERRACAHKWLLLTGIDQLCSQFGFHRPDEWCGARPGPVPSLVHGTGPWGSVLPPPGPHVPWLGALHHLSSARIGLQGLCTGPAQPPCIRIRPHATLHAWSSTQDNGLQGSLQILGKPWELDDIALGSRSGLSTGGWAPLV